MKLAKKVPGHGIGPRSVRRCGLGGVFGLNEGIHRGVFLGRIEVNVPSSVAKKEGACRIDGTGFESKSGVPSRVYGKVNLDSSGKGSIAVAGVGSRKFAAYIALSEVKDIRDLDARNDVGRNTARIGLQATSEVYNNMFVRTSIDDGENRGVVTKDTDTCSRVYTRYGGRAA